MCGFGPSQPTQESILRQHFAKLKIALKLIKKKKKKIQKFYLNSVDHRSSCQMRRHHSQFSINDLSAIKIIKTRLISRKGYPFVNLNLHPRKQKEKVNGKFPSFVLIKF